jgi:hypothetical protein
VKFQTAIKASAAGEISREPPANSADRAVWGAVVGIEMRGG